MAVIGIGADVVHVPRILGLIQRRSPEFLAARILSPAELLEWRQSSSRNLAARAKFLAVRWSLKEAGYKALYPKDKPTWKDFTVMRVDNQKPLLSYNPKSGSTIASAKFHCSVSHDGEYVFSTVLVETD